MTDYEKLLKIFTEFGIPTAEWEGCESRSLDLFLDGAFGGAYCFCFTKDGQFK